MAHRSNVIQVHENIESALKSVEADGSVVTDPVCGRQLERKSARHVLFRENATWYFCSKDCQQGFLNPASKKKAAS